MFKKHLISILVVLFFASTLFAQAAPDPIRISVGARPLGMGKAFVGLADDVGSVYLNPAGLANPDRWQITSMSGKLLEEFNYLSLSGLYPTKFGNIGLAYVGSSIGGALPTMIDVNSDPDDPIYIVDPTQEAMSYYNNLFIMSYGDKLTRILDYKNPVTNFINDKLPNLKNANFGANLKLFSVNLTGDHITGGNASGMEVDLGIQGRPSPGHNWITVGANLQNALPFALGGKLHYDSGWDESYPAVLKAGAAFDLVGPEKETNLRKIGPHRIKLLTDIDYEVSRSDVIPPLFHIGVEWKPMDLIAIRGGIDQEMVGVGQTENNLTGGVGLYYGDFRFDYAYHQFAGAPGVDNHFFSLSYGIAPVTDQDKLIVTPEKLITIKLVEKVKGIAVDSSIITVKVNGIKVKLSPRGEFQTNVSLKVGKNSIKVEGFDKNNKIVDTDKAKILRLITYPDVPKKYWAYEQVGYIGTLGLVKGYPDGSFKPQGNITRAELSTLLVRTKVGGDKNVLAATDQIFDDVPIKHWASKYVNLAVTSKIVKGYPDGTFRPSSNVTRAEGLTMIARFGGVKEIPYTSEAFADLSKNHWASSTIAGAYSEGMLHFLKGKLFEVNKKLTRAEAVEMLYRSRPVAALIKTLLNFNIGY
jgi:S-layer homology domain/Glucodextranase, domain B